VWYSPDGQHVVSGSNDGIVRIWNASKGEAVHELKLNETLYTIVNLALTKYYDPKKKRHGGGLKYNHKNKSYTKKRISKKLKIKTKGKGKSNTKKRIPKKLKIKTKGKGKSNTKTLKVRK
jgi:WD40 repeat protein